MHEQIFVPIHSSIKINVTKCQGALERKNVFSAALLSQPQAPHV